MNHKFQSIIVATGMVLVAHVSAEAQLHTSISVAEHFDVVDIPDATYDSAFTSATNALRFDLGVDDVVCNLKLSRNGGVWYYWGTDKNIDTRIEYETFQSTTDNVPAWFFVF